MECWHQSHHGKILLLTIASRPHLMHDTKIKQQLHSELAISGGSRSLFKKSYLFMSPNDILLVHIASRPHLMTPKSNNSCILS